MKFKSINLMALAFLALTLGFFARTSISNAGGPIGQPIRVILDEDYVQERDKYCGKWEDTSKACNSDYLDCYHAFERIIDNMYDVCSDRPKDCNFDAGQIWMPNDMATLLYDIPVKNFADDSTISKINSCRAQHPKSEDAVVEVKTPERIAEEECRREQDRLREQGLEPTRDCKNLTPPAAQNVENVPAPANENNVAQSQNVGGAIVNDEANAEANAGGGGCSLQYVKSPANVMHAMVAFLLVTLPFALSSRGGRSKQK